MHAVRHINLTVRRSFVIHSSDSNVFRMSFKTALCLCIMLCSMQKPVICRSIDEIIMSAAEDVTMFDLVHMTHEGGIEFLVELDIVLNMTEFMKYISGSDRVRRKAIATNTRLWENATVYYEISAEYNNTERQIISQAFSTWEKYTCLAFKPSSTQHDRIKFERRFGCSSHLGRIGGIQKLYLVPGCFESVGVIVHEIGHAVGWIHEHARPDRDDYIRVLNTNKLPSSLQTQFNKFRREHINARSVEYDYDSIMHYSGILYGIQVIETIDPAAQKRIGQRHGLSFRDIKLANLMYNCAETGGCKTRTCPGEGFQGKDCECYCPGDLNNPLVLCKDEHITPSTRTPPTTSTRTPTIDTNRKCEDLLEICPSLKKNGKCESDAARMSVFCTKTCNMCDMDESGNCMDYAEYCSWFASRGFCNKTTHGSAAEYFTAHCPLSCDQCKPADPCTNFHDARDSSSRCQVSFLLFIFLINNFIANIYFT